MVTSPKLLHCLYVFSLSCRPSIQFSFKPVNIVQLRRHKTVSFWYCEETVFDTELINALHGFDDIIMTASCHDGRNGMRYLSGRILNCHHCSSCFVQVDMMIRLNFLFTFCTLLF